jgi:hypothetical protein
VNQHPFFELLHLQLRKDCELCLPNRQHRRSAPNYVNIHPPALRRQPGYPGSRDRIMIPLGDTGCALCFWHELGRMDRNGALTLLRRLQSDIWAQASLRSAVERKIIPPAPATLNDAQVSEAAADLIASGKLIPVRTGVGSAGFAFCFLYELVLLGHKDTDADGTQDCPLRIGRILRRYDSTACQSTSRERDL